MSRPLPPSPRWSVFLRVGVGLFAFGLLVLLFSAGWNALDLLGLIGGSACLLAAVVYRVTDRPRR